MNRQSKKVASQAEDIQTTILGFDHEIFMVFYTCYNVIILRGGQSFNTR